MSTHEASVENQNPQSVSEDMPLLGRVGDASQREGNPLHWNLFLGTAVLAQVGILLLVVAVWASILAKPVTLFAYHPLLNSTGILFLTQAILILQPTHTASQKHDGTTVHALANGVGFTALIAGLIVIEYNKFLHNGAHFKSSHATLGVITYIVLGLQTIVGFAQYYLPSLFGGVTKAKVIYKYHRMSGYIALVLMLATVATATQTSFNINALHLKLWIVLSTSALVLIGIIPRIRLSKLGYRPHQYTVN